MRLTRPTFTVQGLMIVVGLAGLALWFSGWMARRAEALRVEAANRAVARKQLVLIDEAWAFLKDVSQNARIDVDGGTIGTWGRRKLEALRRAGAGKAEIVAALEKYIDDLEWFQEVAKIKKHLATVTFEEYEIKFLRMEAEIWLNEEKVR